MHHSELFLLLLLVHLPELDVRFFLLRRLWVLSLRFCQHVLLGQSPELECLPRSIWILLCTSQQRFPLLGLLLLGRLILFLLFFGLFWNFLLFFFSHCNFCLCLFGSFLLLFFHLFF